MQIRTLLAQFLCLAGIIFLIGSATGRADPTPDDATPAPPEKVPTVSAKEPPVPAAHKRTGIRWRTWGPDAFAEAKKLNRPVMLDLTAVWCHWCHRLDDDTWADPQVAKLVNERFVPIQVWADQRPDIEARYIGNGWPTVALLTHEGFTFGRGGYQPPRQMISWLGIHADAFATQQPEIAKIVEQNRDAARLQIKAPEQADLNHQLADNLAKTVAEQHVQSSGLFWPKSPWFPQPQLIRFALLQHARTGDKKVQAAAVALLDGMITGGMDAKARAKKNVHGIYDAVEGGFFRYATLKDWHEPHYEKMLSGNADLIVAYLEAWTETGNTEYRRVAEGALRYVATTLTDPKTGRLFGSQDADLFAHDADKKRVDGEAFFVLSAAERAKIGVPHVDKTTYVDSSAKMIGAYATAYARLGEAKYKQAADRAMTFLLKQLVNKNSEVLHYYTAEGKTGGTGILRDYVGLARALLDLYQVDSRPEYLARAIAIMKNVEVGFLHKPTGAYLDIRVADKPLGSLESGHLPLGWNATAVLNLIHILKFTDGQKMFVDTKAMKNRIKAILKMASFAGAGASPGQLSDVAFALENHLTIPALFRVVGKPGDKDTEALVRRSLAARVPVKLVQRLNLEESKSFLEAVFLYPEEPKTFEAAVYLCTTVCQRAARTPEQIAQVIAKMSQTRNWKPKDK